MEIWGLCPKCVDWFAADDWFNPSVPLPTCPSCGMSPSKIRYGSRPAPVEAATGGSALGGGVDLR